MIASAPVALRRSRRPVSLAVLAAVAPVAIAALSVALNRLTLIDDAATLAMRGAQPVELLAIPDTGRYVPLYHLHHWLVLQLFPPRAWVLSLANAAWFAIAAWQVWRLARRLGGAPAAGVAAVWLFALNSATVESLFTLSKAEPKQTVFWLAALLLLLRALDETRDRLTPWEPLALCALTVAALGFKETAVLLAVPLGGFLLATAVSQRRLPRAELDRRIGLAIAVAAPVALSAALSLARGLEAGSYARQHILSPALRAAPAEVALARTEPVLAALLLAGILAGIGLVALRAGHRWPAAVVLLHVVAVGGLFTLLRLPWPYYYFAAAAGAASLVGAAAFPSAGGRAGVTWLAAVLVAPLLLYGADRARTGAAALGGWSWLYSRLTAEVARQRPQRVVFYRSGAPEAHWEARLMWEGLLGLPVLTGVLDPTEDPGRDVRTVSSRALETGDWILEQFGEPYNARLPFRDLHVTRGRDPAVVGSLLPARLAGRFEARFPVAHRTVTLLPSSRTSIGWRIWQLEEAPRVAFEGLTGDRWMAHQAVLWVRPVQGTRMQLRFSSLGAGSVNVLEVYAGARPVARCPSAPGIGVCWIPLAGWDDGRRGDGWSRLELRASRVDTPKALAIGDDDRQLSFNFTPTWDADPTTLFARAGT